MLLTPCTFNSIITHQYLVATNYVQLYKNFYPKPKLLKLRNFLIVIHFKLYFCFVARRRESCHTVFIFVKLAKFCLCLHFSFVNFSFCQFCMGIKMLKSKDNNYEYFIESNKRFYYFSITLPQYPSINDAVLKTNWQLKALLHNTNFNLGNFNDLESLRDYLYKICQKPRTPELSPSYYAAVCQELNDLYDCDLSNDMQNINFTKNDICGRQHSATIRISENYPNGSIIVESHPFPFAEDNFNNVTTITDFYQQFCELIDVFQVFWDTMESIDSNCCVIDPQNPVSSDR